jgi:hypothetical protein
MPHFQLTVRLFVQGVRANSTALAIYLAEPFSQSTQYETALRLAPHYSVQNPQK